jgi:hypothetical protein
MPVVLIGVANALLGPLAIVRASAELPVAARHLPPGLADSTFAGHLREACELDLFPLNAVLPSKGFGYN